MTGLRLPWNTAKTTIRRSSARKYTLNGNRLATTRRTSSIATYVVGRSAAASTLRSISAMNSTPRPGLWLSYHAAASMNSARAARRKVTDRLISRFASAQSPLPHPRQLHRPDWRHGRQSAGRARPSARLSDLARHFDRRCYPKAPRRIQAALPPTVGELGLTKKYSPPHYSARRRR